MKGYYLDHKARLKLSEMYNAGKTPLEISVRLDVHVSTIYRELERGFTGEFYPGGGKRYDPERAQAVFDASIKNRGKAYRESETEREEVKAG